MARKLEIEIVGDASSLRRALKQSDSGLDKFGSGAKKAGKLAAAGFAVAGVAIAVGAKKAVQAASNLQESQNAVSVVFGKSAKAVNDFSKKAVREAGLSMREFNELVTPIGASLINMGDSSDKAAQKSINLAKRAADMASVFNVDVKDALGAIQAGLRGEADPLERFGVGLSDAAIKAKAAQMGMKLVHGELTAGQKGQARYALLMEQTNRVAGDFKNTSGGLANSQRILSAEWENLQAKIGQKLIPVFTAVVSYITNTLIPTFERHWPAIQKIVGDVISAIKGFYDTKLRPVLQAIGDAIRNLARTAEQEWPKVKNAAQQVSTWYSTQLKPTMQKALDDAREAHSHFGGQTGAVLRSAFSVNIGLARGYIGTLTGVLNAGMAVIRGDWRQAWDSLVGIVSNWRQRVGGAVDAAAGQIVGQLRGLGAAMVGGVMAGIGSMAGALRDKFVGVIRAAKDAALGFLHVKSPSKLTAQEIGKPMVEGVAKGIIDNSRLVSAALKGALQAAVSRKDFGTVSSIIGSMFSAKQGQVKTKLEKEIAGIERGRTVEDLNQGIANAGKSLADAVAELARLQAGPSADEVAAAFKSGGADAVNALRAEFAAKTPEAAAQIEEAKRAEARAKQDLQLFQLREKAERERAKLDAKQLAEQVKLGMALDKLSKLFDKQHVTSGQLLKAVSRMLHKLGVPGFAQGGVVPGPRGAPQLAMVHGGETVLPANRGNVTIPISIGGEHIATVVFDQLRQKAKVFERRNGKAAF